MNNLEAYLRFRSDITLKQSPFNEVDAMIFAALAAIDFEGVLEDGNTLSEISKKFDDMGRKDNKDERMVEKIKLLKACGESKRFKDVKLCDFVKDINEEEVKTFYAVSFYTSRHEVYVGFRGTDGSLISWKENFMTLCKMPTEGQQEALRYLSKVCSKHFIKVNVLGHSKGGNLAVFAAMSLDMKLQRKLGTIYALDAPGFINNIEDKLGYQNIKDRIRAVVPVGCVIGNLMKPPYERIVVSAEGNGIYQHDMFNWNVLPCGVETVESTNNFSKDLSDKMNNWIESLPEENRRDCVEELFSVFSNNGIMHITDLLHMDVKKIFHIVMALKSLSQENREFLSITIKELWASH